jgi:hypothetical protein
MNTFVLAFVLDRVQSVHYCATAETQVADGSEHEEACCYIH